MAYRRASLAVFRGVAMACEETVDGGWEFTLHEFGSGGRFTWGAREELIALDCRDDVDLGLAYWGRHDSVLGGTLWVGAAVLWPIPLLLWTPAALLLRSGYRARRRAMTGRCSKCGYDLTGLGADAPCPECGKAKTV